MKRKSNKSKSEAQPTQVEHCSLLSGECDIEDSDSVDSEDSDTAEASSLLPIGLHYFVSFHRNKSELSKAQIIKYYFNRQSLPCLPTSLLDKSSSNNSVVALLLNAEQCYKEFIATSNPVRVKHNVRFLINLDELNDCEDLLSDDLGSWNQTKTKKKWYETRFKLVDRKKWDRKEFKDSRRNSFSKYFRRYKAEEIWNHVTAKSIKNAGFEDEVQANNISESANAFLKRWQDFQATDMASFIEDCRGLITKQRRDVQRALLGLSSPYILRPEYQGSVKGTDTFLTNNLVIAITPLTI
ncbi:unnamed protein product [Porites lobata]|uniref:Uncharacterized protein n=1 Tax=Porites lobata TaxID=104759 RepID=A0ABN8NVS3_9CNID|nr:unnamed protein product [Porites lobata]